MFSIMLDIASTEDFHSSKHAIRCAVNAGINRSCHMTHLMPTHGGMLSLTTYICMNHLLSSFLLLSVVVWMRRH